jgi:serine/threonine protein kinase
VQGLRVEAKSQPKPEPSPARPPAPPAPQPEPKPPDTASRLEELVGKQPNTLAAYLKDSPPQVEEVILPFVATVQALIGLHATGGKKEALSPQGISFDRLGKAAILVQPVTSSRRTSSAAANPRYAAPEMFSEKAGGNADAGMTAAQIYALGVMFYEILLGKRLFAKSFAEQRSELDWMRWHADPESKAPTLKSLLPDYPTALSDLIESMMNKVPEKRPADLDTILTRLRSIAQRANKTVVLSKKPAEKARRPANDRDLAPAPPKSHVGLWILAVLAVLAAGGGFWLWQNPDFVRTVIAPLLHFSTN